LLTYRLVLESDELPHDDFPEGAVHGEFDLEFMKGRIIGCYVIWGKKYTGQGGLRTQALRTIMGGNVGQAFARMCVEYMEEKSGLYEFNYKQTTMPAYRDAFQNWKEASAWLKHPVWHPDPTFVLPISPGVYHSADIRTITPTETQLIEARDGALVGMLYTAIVDLDCIIDKTTTGNKINKVVMSRYSPIYITAACWKVLVSTSSSVNVNQLLTICSRTMSRSFTPVVKLLLVLLSTQPLKFPLRTSTVMAKKSTQRVFTVLARRPSKEET
jgi:hypothetical protein